VTRKYRRSRTPEERFWAMVDKSGDCWLWTGYTDHLGYARFWTGAKQSLVHRFSYELAYGEIPKGLVLDHLCRMPSCVRLSHLEVVTQRINLLRGTGFAATNAVKTHCVNGHEYTEENTYWRLTSTGWGRDCRACKYLRNREVAEQKREV